MTDNPLALVSSEQLVTELRRRYPAHVMAFVYAADGGAHNESIRTFASTNMIVAAGLVAWLKAVTDASIITACRPMGDSDNRFDGLGGPQPPQWSA
jgi:hypothetical protein